MGFLKQLFGSAEPTDEPKKERHPLEDSVNYYYPTSDTDIALMKTSVAGITHTDSPKYDNKKLRTGKKLR